MVVLAAVATVTAEVSGGDFSAQACGRDSPHGCARGLAEFRRLAALESFDFELDFLGILELLQCLTFGRAASGAQQRAVQR